MYMRAHILDGLRASLTARRARDLASARGLSNEFSAIESAVVQDRREDLAVHGGLRGLPASEAVFQCWFDAQCPAPLSWWHRVVCRQYDVWYKGLEEERREHVSMWFYEYEQMRRRWYLPRQLLPRLIVYLVRKYGPRATVWGLWRYLRLRTRLRKSDKRFPPSLNALG
jgi:hypothetical protein